MRYTTAAALFYAGLVASSPANSGSNGHSYNSADGCPGAMVDNDYCCIGGNLSNCPGWPMCTGLTSFDLATPTCVTTCVTTIATSLSNWEDLASSASTSYLNDAGAITASATGGNDSPVQTGSATTKVCAVAFSAVGERHGLVVAEGLVIAEGCSRDSTPMVYNKG